MKMLIEVLVNNPQFLDKVVDELVKKQSGIKVYMSASHLICAILLANIHSLNISSLYRICLGAGQVSHNM